MKPMEFIILFRNNNMFNNKSDETNPPHLISIFLKICLIQIFQSNS